MLSKSHAMVPCDLKTDPMYRAHCHYTLSLVVPPTRKCGVSTGEKNVGKKTTDTQCKHGRLGCSRRRVHHLSYRFFSRSIRKRCTSVFRRIGLDSRTRTFFFNFGTIFNNFNNFRHSRRGYVPFTTLLVVTCFNRNRSNRARVSPSKLEMYFILFSPIHPVRFPLEIVARIRVEIVFESFLPAP